MKIVGMLDEYQLGEAATVADRCPHCERDTSLEVLENHRMAPDWEKRAIGLAGAARLPFFPQADEFTLLRVFRCMYCGQTVLVELRWDAGDGNDPAAVMVRPAVEAEIIWPDRSSRELPQETPGPVRDIFREASVCEAAGAFRGAAGLLRACVEEITSDQGATGRNLQDKINDLGVKVPTLGADMIRDLHDARLTGNWSLHDRVTFAADEVADVASLIEEAVDVIYVQPARRAAMAAARTTRRQGQGP